MVHELGAVRATKKAPDEPFHDGGKPRGFDLQSFWQWSASDLLGNATRGVLAEYLVARALGSADEPRVEWDAVDVRTPEGVTVEVKASAYVQSWEQERLSTITFATRSTRGWDAISNTSSVDRRRQADVYVFCLLAHRDQETVDPLDLSQWRFFVVSTRRLDVEIGEQKSVALSRLQAIGASEVEYDSLAVAVAAAANDEGCITRGSS